jgi:hypothetical protein
MNQTVRTLPGAHEDGRVARHTIAFALLLAAVFLRHGATKLRAQPSDASL